MKNISKSLLAASVSATLFIGSAHGAGFSIVEQSVSGLGTSFAGAAASAEDASTVFFNPAGMMALDKGASLVGALHVIQPSTEFTDSGFSTAGGGDGSDAGVSAVVPNLYYVGEASDNMRFGLGIGAPFGLATEYDDGWKGRYYGIESALQTININPAVAFKVHDKLSIGVGLNVQYANATLTSAVNGAGLCAYLQGIGVIPGGCAAPTDIDAEVTGDSIDWGVNYGVLYSMSDATRIGFHYRSGMRHVLKGDAEFTGTAPELAAAGFLVDSDAEAVLNLPATAALSVSHKLSPKMTLLGDAMWTNWDQMSELRVSYDVGNQGDTVEDLSWKNTGRYSVGMLYGMSDVMTLRAGLALDQSPVPNEEHRSVRVPDADRTWVSLGLGYKLAGNMQLDAAFAHLMVDDADINKVDALKGTLVGEYEAEVNIFSVQASMPF
jgi:long-chain fatty acid transport protein